MSFINATQNISSFDQYFFEHEDIIREVHNLNNTCSYPQSNYKSGNTLFHIIEDPFLERGSIREDFPDLNISAIKEDDDIDDSVLTIEPDRPDRASNKYYHDISPEVHSQIGTPLWTMDQEGIIGPVLQGLQNREGQQDEFSFESMLFQSEKVFHCKDLILGSINSSLDWSRSTKTAATQGTQGKLKPKKAVSKARDTTFGTLSTSKDSGNQVANPFFNDQNQDHSWLGFDQAVQPNSTLNLLDITGTTQTEDKNTHGTFLSDKAIEQQQQQQLSQQGENYIINRRDMTIEPKNFRFVVKACEKIVDGAFGTNKEDNKRDPRDSVKAINDYMRDYEKLAASSGKGDPLVQGGKEIYDEMIKLRQNVSEQELVRRINNCRIEMPLPLIELQMKGGLKNRETAEILKHCERKKQYTTFKSFESCESEEETLRRWMICCVARKWMVTQDMPLEMHNMQGEHALFILAVLQGDLSIDNKIRMLDFKCKGTRHVDGMFIKFEKKLRKKLEKLNSDWIVVLDRIMNLMGLNNNGDFSSTVASSEGSVTQDTRSQTVASPLESEIEAREETTKKEKERLREILQRKFAEIWGIVVEIETRQGHLRDGMKNELMLAKDFINRILGNKEKDADNLVLMADMCLNMLNNGLRRYQIAQMYFQRYGSQSNLEKRPYENLQEIPEAHMNEREGIKKFKQ